MSNPAQVNHFAAMIDGTPLGEFMKVEGLSVAYDVAEYNEGGENGFVHKLPGRAKYENITLTRPVSELTTGLAAWFESYRVLVKRTTGRIMAQQSDGSTVFVWNFMGAFPVSWKVSGMDVAGNGVLTETLVIAHEGFLP
jgi:phage tail-like protein